VHPRGRQGEEATDRGRLGPMHRAAVAVPAARGASHSNPAGVTKHPESREMARASLSAVRVGFLV